LNELKAKRKQFNLTQSQLAELANVSQSLIAKIESDAVVPSYDNAKRLFDCLERLQLQQSVTAASLMNTKIVVVHENDSVKKAIGLMEKKAISQLPVLNSAEACVGSVNEEGILKRVSKASGSTIDLSTLKVGEIINDSLPSILPDTPIKIVQSMLEHNAAVLVATKGKIRGIITKADLLKEVLKKK
jgi:predicted transcriptional regulator